MSYVPLCHRCGMTCEILHKCQTIVTPAGTYYFHDAYDGDCYTKEKAEHQRVLHAAMAYGGL